MYAGITRFLSGIFIAVILLFGAAILFLPYVVSTDTIRIRLAQDLSAWTGHNVQLRDPPRLSLFPYPKAFLSGVTLAPDIHNVAPLMEAESIEVDLSLVDLLWGRISFLETRIIRPQFIMEKPVRTVAGFFDTLSRSKGALGLAIRNAREIIERNPDQLDDIEGLLNQPFGRIVIENGVLIYCNSVSRVSEKITGLNATIDWPESTQSARFRARARWHGELTELVIDANQALLLLAGEESQLKASFNSLRGGITFTGQAKLSEYYIFDGKISMHSPGLDQTLAWIGSYQIWGHSLKIPIVWESRFLAQPTGIQLNNIMLSMGTSHARGALEFDIQNQIPVIIGSLGFNTLDINILKTIFSSVEEENKCFDITFFDRIGLDVRLSASQAKVEDVTLTNLAAAIQIRNGQAIFDLGNVNIFGGALQSNIQIVPDGKKLRIKGRVSGTSVDLQAISRVLGMSSFVQAKTDLIMTMQMVASGWSKSLVQVQGQLILDMLSGRLLGYNLDDLHYKLSENKQFLLAYDNILSTSFDRLNIKASFADDIMTVTKLLMHTADWNLLIQEEFTDIGTESKSNELTLQARLQKNNRSETLCKDVECLANSLARPFVFVLSPTGQTFGTFFVKVNPDNN